MKQPPALETSPASSGADHEPPDPGLSALWDHLPLAVFLLDRRGGVLACNRGARDLFGDPDPGTSLAHLLPGAGDRLPALLGELEQASPVRLRPDGAAPHGELGLAALGDSGLVLAWLDHTGAPPDAELDRLRREREALERECRELRSRLRDQDEAARLLLLAFRKNDELDRLCRDVEVARREWEETMNCVEDMVLLADGHGRIRKCNQAVLDFTGKSEEQILGRDWRDILPEEEVRIRAVLGRGMEFQHRPSGRWFVLKSYPFRNVACVGEGTVITLHDSTEVKRMTQALEEKTREISEHRAKLQAALDKISSLIRQVARERGFGIRFTNPDLQACHRIRDCSRTDCPCHGRGPLRCWQVVGDYAASPDDGPGRAPRGCAACPVFGLATSDPIYEIGEHFNNMMQILEGKNRALEEAYAELKETQAKILQQEKMASIGQLAAGVAHEINNPMGFISSNLGTLEKYASRLAAFTRTQAEAAAPLLPPEERERLEAKKREWKIDYILSDIQALIRESQEGAQRVRTIVQNLKSFSRLDETKEQPADLNECLESTINIVWNEIKYKATLRREYGELPLTRCRPQELNQVFMNLLVNAAHAMESQGEIRVRTWAEGGSIYVEVADTGCGIPEENLSRIFEPFFTTKEVGKGTGLGLSIAYDIVKKHGGEISVESTMGEGTTFRVRIPVVEGDGSG